MTWNEAKSFCETLDVRAHLIEIFDSSQHTFMSQKSQEVFGGFVGSWIGLKKEPNIFIWDYSQLTATFFYWNSGYPLSASGRDYVALNNGGITHKWYNTYEYANHYPICQLSGNFSFI